MNVLERSTSDGQTTDLVLIQTLTKSLFQDITSATQVDLFRQREEYFGAILGFFAIQLEIIRSPLGGLLQSVEECHKLWVK
eukprot:877929-Amorphochlora_amoeboformis.AAC.1